MSFPTAAAPFYILTGNAQRFQFVHILTNTCYFLSLFGFYQSHFKGGEVLKILTKNKNTGYNYLMNEVSLISSYFYSLKEEITSKASRTSESRE